ncbi:hypothetical protein TEA_028548 [Camellia sinensis var. sinensis]|uniref:Uncharacterized protein n=1 Tax=Camellia sinensis var. sinensis TaxID=542762 RepID=A0A4S4DGQ9_CAMSN|nr:hypothetical protein TEA_028548 [Camellia sinensis var. sinensis]
MCPFYEAVPTVLPVSPPLFLCKSMLILCSYFSGFDKALHSNSKDSNLGIRKLFVGNHKRNLESPDEDAFNEQQQLKALEDMPAKSASVEKSKGLQWMYIPAFIGKILNQLMEDDDEVDAGKAFWVKELGIRVLV